MMDMIKAIEKACEKLPEGYQLILFLENGAAYFEMYDSEYCKIDLGDPTDKSLAEQIEEAIAKSLSGKG